MGLNTFEVLLDNPSRQYFPGSTITGQVIVTVNGDETATAITIRLFGAAETRWVESRRVYVSNGNHGGHTRTVYNHFHSHQSLFDMMVLLFGDGENKHRIPPQGMRIPFSFQLPTIPLPISCTLKNGFVEYAVEGKIKQPWYKSDWTSTVPFMILPVPLDLMTVPAAGIPSLTTEEKRFGSCCCQSEPLIVSAKTSFRGWCMGDHVPVVAEIFNKSDRQVVDVTAQIVQIWTMYAASNGILSSSVHSRNHTEVLGTGCRRGEGIQPGDTGVWQFTLQVPFNIPPTPYAGACEIVKMEYCIQLELFADGDSLVANLPIIVGNNRLEPALVSEHSTLYEGVGSG